MVVCIIISFIISMLYHRVICNKPGYLDLKLRKRRNNDV